jgi:hypothetical protein
MRFIPPLLFLCVATTSAAAQWSVDLETGAVWAGYAEVRVPNDTGDMISYTEDLDAAPSAFVRARLGMHPGGKHHFYIELAPLSVTSTGALDSAVDFAGTAFPAGTDVDALFRFDTYRLLYRYRFAEDERVRSAWGVTLLLRDAELRITGGGLKGVSTNVGVVPLVGFEYARRMADPWWFVFDVNAAAGPQGRAEDLFLGVKYESSDRFALNAGYRLIEGGAEVDEVFAFAGLNHVSVGATLRF